MSDRKNPNYRNSIKESISAVESMCKIITGKDSATLGQALKVIEDHTTIQPKLKTAFEKFYEYTNNPQDGIRHASIDIPTPNFDDAKFMLVTCSAFVNYLKTKIK